MIRNAKTNFLRCTGYASFTKDRIKPDSLPTLHLALLRNYTTTELSKLNLGSWSLHTFNSYVSVIYFSGTDGLSDEDKQTLSEMMQAIPALKSEQAYENWVNNLEKSIVRVKNKEIRRDLNTYRKHLMVSNIYYWHKVMLRPGKLLEDTKIKSLKTTKAEYQPFAKKPLKSLTFSWAADA